jgi:predicted metal-dependent enzyme (double-stranded beta helix superfamily)
MHSLTRLFLGAALSATMFTSAIAADLNPAAVTYTLPDKIEWKQGSGRNQQAILAGDPSKPGLYVVMVKWLPGGMSRPHFHPNDRFITVLRGTWWVARAPSSIPTAQSRCRPAPSSPISASRCTTMAPRMKRPYC